MEKKKDDGLALFVRAKPGCMVRRFGTKQQIGVIADGKGKVTFDCVTIHALSNTEFARHRREYDNAIHIEKALDVCTREEWEKQRAEKREKAQEAAKAAAKAQENDNKQPAEEPGKDG